MQEYKRRRYIIAGDIQGSRLLGMVLSEYMKEHPDYYEKIICTYRIGENAKLRVKKWFEK